MGLDFSVCIPSAILCAKLPCVVPPVRSSSGADYPCYLGPDLYSKGSCERMQLPDSYELAGSKMVLNIDCAVQKSEAAKL